MYTDETGILRSMRLSTFVFFAGLAFAQQSRPAFHPETADLARVRAKTEQLEAALRPLHGASPDLLADVAVYAKAGRFLLEYPELVASQAAVDHAVVVLDRGLERAAQLAAGKAGWTSGKRQLLAYRSAIDGSVQPYAVTLPDSYDAARPARLYVWLHGRQNNTIETEFLYSQQTFRPANPPVADVGQITLDCFSRVNG